MDQEVCLEVTKRCIHCGYLQIRVPNESPIHFCWKPVGRSCVQTLCIPVWTPNLPLQSLHIVFLGKLLEIGTKHQEMDQDHPFGRSQGPIMSHSSCLLFVQQAISTFHLHLEKSRTGKIRQAPEVWSTKSTNQTQPASLKSLKRQAQPTFN